jgi:hypothetical protein
MKDPLSETRLDFTEKIAVRDDRQRTGMAPGKRLPVITNRRARRRTTKDENQVRCTYKIFEAKFAFQCVSTALGAPGRTRTCDTRFRKPLLYPLSYGGST